MKREEENITWVLKKRRIKGKLREEGSRERRGEGGRATEREEKQHSSSG